MIVLISTAAPVVMTPKRLRRVPLSPEKSTGLQQLHLSNRLLDRWPEVDATLILSISRLTFVLGVAGSSSSSLAYG